MLVGMIRPCIVEKDDLVVTQFVITPAIGSASALENRAFSASIHLSQPGAPTVWFPSVAFWVNSSLATWPAFVPLGGTGPPSRPNTPDWNGMDSASVGQMS